MVSTPDQVEARISQEVLVNTVGANALTSGGHQQKWYQQYMINGSLSSMGNDFDYMHHLSEKIDRKWKYIFDSYTNSAHQG